MVNAPLRLIVGLTFTRNLTVELPLNESELTRDSQFTDRFTAKSQFCAAETLTVNSPPLVGTLIELDPSAYVQFVGFCNAAAILSRPLVRFVPARPGVTYTVFKRVAFTDDTDNVGF